MIKGQINNDLIELYNSVAFHTPNVEQSFLETTSIRFTACLENTFYSYGKFISDYPKLFILFSLTIPAICAIGLLDFTTENRPFKLWIPQDSDFIKVFEWQKHNFRNEVRVHSVIYEAENVLTKDVIREILKIHKEIENIKVSGVSWFKTCLTLPTAPKFISKNESDIKWFSLPRQERDTDWFFNIPHESYCSYQRRLKETCMENSILELWGYNESILDSLTNENIVYDVNYEYTSQVFGHQKDFIKYLGGVEKDKDGMIIGAKATIHTWSSNIISNEKENVNFVLDPQSGIIIDKRILQWEKRFIAKVIELNDKNPNMSIYVNAARSYGDVSDVTIKDDSERLALGFVVVLFYIILMLGNSNFLEFRPLLSLVGISSIAISIVVSYGMSSAFGISYGPVNNVLPFLLLGIGVDDMFVIVQTWTNLKNEEKKLPLNEQMGLALKHAGVSITVTSVTDFMVFLIGSITALPALRSFCLYAAIGIAALYIFQLTYFMAFFCIDQKRINSKRNSLFCCWKMKNWFPNGIGQNDILKAFFKDIYGHFLLKNAIKTTVMLFTVIIFLLSIIGTIKLRQEFNHIWFLPQDSYLYTFFDRQNELFPSAGEEGVVFFGNVSLTDELENIEELINKMQKNKYISEIDDWYSPFKTFCTNKYKMYSVSNMTDSVFEDSLSEFLFSPLGLKYKSRNFQFTKRARCNKPIPEILSSSINYKHNVLKNSKDKILAMDSVKEIVNSIDFAGYVECWAQVYSTWETDRIISKELYQNMFIAMIAVFLITVFMIASLKIGAMIMLCVFMTLVDVAALMNWWGLTIDTVSCIDLVLAVGLCVDYSVHIGYTFMTIHGTRDTRTKLTLEKIGPAVLNGGLSTFLAFILLANSKSHVFTTFFKIFFGVCFFGLYHGLVFLPVLLSMYGPTPYALTNLDLLELEIPSPRKRNSVDTIDTISSNICYDQSITATPSDSPIATSKYVNPADLTKVSIEDESMIDLAVDSASRSRKPSQESIFNPLRRPSTTAKLRRASTLASFREFYDKHHLPNRIHASTREDLNEAATSNQERVTPAERDISIEEEAEAVRVWARRPSVEVVPMTRRASLDIPARARRLSVEVPGISVNGRRISNPYIIDGATNSK